MGNRDKFSAVAQNAQNIRADSGYSHDMRDFADNDGDAPGKHLSLKVKEAKSSDRMPSVDQAYDSDKKVRMI